MTSGQDAPPAPPAPSLPHTALLQQARADRAKQEAKERKNNLLWRSRAGLTNLALPPGLYRWYCISTALCGYATNIVETGTQACSHAAAEMCRRTTCTHERTHRHTLTCTDAHTQAHTRTHTCTGAHMRTNTDTLSSTLAHTHAHTHTHALAVAPMQHAELAHACSSSSSSDNNNSKSGSGFHCLLEFVGGEGGYTQTPGAPKFPLREDGRWILL